MKIILSFALLVSMVIMSACAPKKSCKVTKVKKVVKKVQPKPPVVVKKPAPVIIKKVEPEEVEQPTPIIEAPSIDSKESTVR